MNKKSILSRDEHEIICDQLDIKGVKSIVLIGSRAKGDAKKNSDYDIYVVVSALNVPFIYKNIEEKVKILENMLGAKVSIAPLTLNRIRKGNDLLLFKTKKEGITICGKDYLPSIKIDRVEDIPFDELFSYLFSSVYFLVEHFDPENIQKMADKECIYNVAKSIMYCVETQLLMQGIYEAEGEDMIRRATEELDLDDSILTDITLSHAVLNGNFLCMKDPIKFWSSARNYILLVFQQLAERFLGAKSKFIEDLVETYKRSKRSFIKNLQYSILVWMKERKYHLFSVFTEKSIEKYLYCSLFYLMLSIEENTGINEESLNNSYQTLHSIRLLPKIEDNNDKIKLWREVKNIIMGYWPMACGKSVI